MMHSVILDKYKHLPSFLAIYTETERIMGKMKQALRESLTANLAACDNSSGTDVRKPPGGASDRAKSKQTSTRLTSSGTVLDWQATRKRLEQVAETMRLLLDLNEDPTPLRKQFLTMYEDPLSMMQVNQLLANATPPFQPYQGARESLGGARSPVRDFAC